MNEFIEELIKLTGISKEYAVACWYVYRNSKNPKKEIYYLAEKIKFQIIEI